MNRNVRSLLGSDSCVTSFELFDVPRGEGLHLADGDGVEAFDAVALGQSHVNELDIHVLDVREDEELFETGVIAHVAVFVRVRIPPLTGGLAEEGDIEEISLAGVGEGGLLWGDFGGNQMGLNGVGVVDPLARSKHKAIQTRPISKPLEFEGFKIWVVQALPHAKEFHGVSVSHPILDYVIGASRFLVLCDIGDRDIILVFPPNHGDFRASDLDFFVGGFLFHASTSLPLIMLVKNMS